MPAETPEQETQEAQQYWGYLVKQDKCGTDLLNRLLRGIANHIVCYGSHTLPDVEKKLRSATVQPDENCPDLTPSQLAEFYKSVGGDYDVLFIDTVPNSISFIYKSLGCVHSLHPPKGVDKYEDPSIPALKPQGFVTWQTIQLLLGPEEHVPFLQNAVKKFDITDPANGKVFPKLLPPECLPTTPDEDMLTWYDSVSQRLQADAEAVDAEQSDRAQLGAPHYGHGLSPGPGPVGHLSRTESYAITADARPSFVAIREILHGLPLLIMLLTLLGPESSKGVRPSPGHFRQHSVLICGRRVNDRMSMSIITPTTIPVAPAQGTAKTQRKSLHKAAYHQLVTTRANQMRTDNFPYNRYGHLTNGDLPNTHLLTLLRNPRTPRIRQMATLNLQTLATYLLTSATIAVLILTARLPTQENPLSANDAPMIPLPPLASTSPI
ncbi:MAG: hypothetical protein Q9157_003198 [Trypethelium eluteriae]